MAVDDVENKRYWIIMGERYRAIVEKAEPVLRALDGKLVRVGIDPPPKYSGGTWEGACVLPQECLHDVREMLDHIGGVNAYARKHTDRLQAYLEARKAEAVNGVIPPKTYTETLFDEREALVKERDRLRELLREALPAVRHHHCVLMEARPGMVPSDYYEQREKVIEDAINGVKAP